MAEKINFNSINEFETYIIERYGKDIAKIIRNSIEYTGEKEKPVVYTYWEHDGTPNNITFFQSLADQEFPSALETKEDE